MSSPDHHWRVKPFLAPWALQHVLRWENVKKKSTKVFHLTLAFPSSSRSLFLVASWIFLPTSLTSSYPPLGPSFLQVRKVGFREVWSSLLIFLFLFFQRYWEKGVDTSSSSSSTCRGRSWMRIFPRRLLLCTPSSSSSPYSPSPAL